MLKERVNEFGYSCEGINAVACGSKVFSASLRALPYRSKPFLAARFNFALSRLNCEGMSS